MLAASTKAKLLREWKTFALSVSALLISIYDIIATNGLNYAPLVPEKYQPYLLFLYPFLMLALRKWRDKETQVTDAK